MAEYDPHPRRSFAVLCYVALTYLVAQTSVLPALPRLIHALHTNAGDVAWTVTAYFLTGAVSAPIVGRLGDMFGKRRMATVAVLCFAGGGLVAAMTSNLWVVVVGRGIQGLGGAVFPLSYGITRDLFPPELRSRAVGLLAATNGLGSALGLIVGGLIVDHMSYHWIFWLSVLMGGTGAVALHFIVPESPIRMPGKVDTRGALVLGLGLATGLFGVSRAASWGWTSGRVTGLIAAGLAILLVWVVLELRTAHPLANIALLRSTPVLTTNFATLLIAFGMLGTFVLVIEIAEAPRSSGYGLGLSATGAGLLLLPGLLMNLLLAPAGGALGARLGNKVPLAIGGALTGGGLSSLAIAHDTRLQVLLLTAVLTAGQMLAYTAMTNLIIDFAPHEQTGEAMGFNALLQRAGTTIGAQVTATILASSAVLGSSLPTGHGYTLALFVCAILSLAGGAVALIIPRRPYLRPAVGGMATAQGEGS